MMSFLRKAIQTAQEWNEAMNVDSYAPDDMSKEQLLNEYAAAFANYVNLELSNDDNTDTMWQDYYLELHDQLLKRLR